MPVESVHRFESSGAHASCLTISYEKDQRKREEEIPLKKKEKQKL